MSIFITSLMLLATGIIMFRGFSLISTLSHKKWTGCTFEFFGFSTSIACVMAGAGGILFNHHSGPILLLVGMAGWMFFNRRF